MKKRRDSPQSSSSSSAGTTTVVAAQAATASGSLCMEMTGLTESQPLHPPPPSSQRDCDTASARMRDMKFENGEGVEEDEEDEGEELEDPEEAERQPLHHQQQRSADVSKNNNNNSQQHNKRKRKKKKGTTNDDSAATGTTTTTRLVSKSVQLNDHQVSNHSRNGCTGATAAACGMHSKSSLVTAPATTRLTASSPTFDKRTSSILLKRGDTRLSLDQSGLQRLLPSFMQYAFADQEAESIYQQYYDNEKRSHFKVLIHILIMTSGILLILFTYYTFGTDGRLVASDPASMTRSSSDNNVVVGDGGTSDQMDDDYVQPSTRWISLSSLTICLISVLTAGFLSSSPTASTRSSSTSSSTATATSSFCKQHEIWSMLTLIMWLIQVMHTTTYLWLFPISRSPGDAISLILVYTFMIYVIFPLRLRYCVLFAVTLDVIHVSLILSTPVAPESFASQVLAIVILLSSVNCLGLMAFFFYEKQQRRAFLETCQSLEAKLVLEEESLKQERLLLSVLPQHVASEIRRDLGAVVQGQFKKIYMSRHENVSILFADIVGFTAISSTCPAAELVRTLNELFARFDKLADKYHQLRIKILGDCYYCISGAPDERKDHAVLCVHMGLSMVEAIKSVREQTKSPVDMRVGIHTGGILAGVMGQKQWQFDVYSKDVELANKMESGGLPGMVHISERTYSFLNGEFEVKDGEGSSREEAIRLAGIRTYFIVKTLKQWPEGTLDALLSPRADSIPQNNCPAATFDPDEENDTVIGASGEIINVEEYNRRLLHELLNRESESSVRQKTKNISMKFVDASSESLWRNTHDVSSCVSLVSLPITLASCFLTYLLIGPNCQLVPISLMMLGNSILLIMALLSCASSISTSLPKAIITVSKAAVQKSWIRLSLMLVMMLIWIACHVIASISCNEEVFGINNAAEGNSCNHPVYFVHFATIGMIAFSVVTSISYILKMILVMILASAQIYLNFTHLITTLVNYDIRRYGFELSFGHESVLSVIIVTTCIILLLMNRQSELVSRRLFLWKKEVEEQKEKVGDMRRKNEALVYNILPPHVAIHFLGKRKKDEELYSKSYNCVGVLFAAMPNFSDFYTEESVNNQGLECLRFLNEVISDYDALLESEKFKGVIKIKTISSTYMAASGLSDEDETEVDESGSRVTRKWSHLSRLTQFALALQETLNHINRESFNNFVLRIGLNQGPITAGVIGARKPHYDIWGNTVNVASRMESTGKAGSIQVVQETKDILEELGYSFEQRGLVSVKGKGMLRTFYLVSSPHHA